MAALQFKFTLSHAAAGTQVISEPIGWKEIEFNVERHPEFHSLVESIDVPIELWGSDGVNDGGYDFFKACLVFGLDMQIGLLIEVKELDNGAYEQLFEGQLQTHLYKDFPYLKKVQVPIARSDLWAKFISRKSYPIDLKSTASVDGVTVNGHGGTAVNLPTQIIRQYYTGRVSEEITYVITGSGQYGVIDFGLVVLDEIKTKFNYPQLSSLTRPFELFDVDYGGEYLIDLVITLTGASGVDRVTNINVMVQINDDAAVAATITQQGTNGVDGTTKFVYSANHTLDKHDQIRVYFQSTGSGDFIFLASHLSDISYLQVIGDTIDEDSDATAYLVHDAGLCIMDRLVSENNSFYSEYFGGSQSDIIYGADGCGYGFSILKGVHVRGYSIAAKPFLISFDDWWNGLNPIFGLGLGYEAMDSTPDSDVIRVEQIANFYDNSSDSVSLTNVDGEKIEISVDDDIIFKKVKAGFTKWEAESASGIDDHQTVHDYISLMRILGNDKDLISPFYAASLGIEQTRRNRIDQSRDWRLDEDVMILQMDMTASPKEPKTFDDADFGNLINAGSRYNTHLNPYMHMHRWSALLGVGFFLTGVAGGYEFAGGEGNILMTFNDGVGATCEPTFNANQDASPNSVTAPIHSGLIYRFNHPLTYTQYKAIIAARKKSIGVSYIDHRTGATVNISGFIKKMTYAINQGMANFEIWKEF